jgi:hypothetical protein
MFMINYKFLEDECFIEVIFNLVKQLLGEINFVIELFSPGIYETSFSAQINGI